MSRPTWRKHVGMLDHPGPAGSAKGQRISGRLRSQEAVVSNATTGSDRVVPGQQQPKEQGFAARHG